MYDKEFKLIILKKLSEMQENTNKQLNIIRRTMHGYNEKFNLKREIIKKELNGNLGAE